MISEEIKLEDSNLYSSGEVLAFPDGTSLLRGKFIDYKPTDRDQYHTVKRGDNFRKIAALYYKKQKENPHLYWHYIVKANPFIINPLDIESIISREIVIPDIVNFELIYT